MNDTSTSWLPPSENLALLDQSVDELPISEEFADMMRTLGFHNLRELLQYPAYQLLAKPGFGYRMLKELLSLLESNGLSKWLKE